MDILNRQGIALVLIGIRHRMNTNIIKRNTSCFLSFVFLLGYIFSFGQTLNDNKQIKNILLYEIFTDSDISQNKILRLEIFENVTSAIGQTPISYDYCKTIDLCERSFDKLKDGKIVTIHDEITGLTKKSDLIWIHPPRFDNFRILELNAFPYYKKYYNSWEKSITFGNEWGNEKWITWEGFKTSKSIYTKSDHNIQYLLGNKKIECVEIQASTTIPDVGKTNSTFYYNEKYGFVHMIFTTINNKKIELKLIKVLNDSDPN